MIGRRGVTATGDGSRLPPSPPRSHHPLDEAGVQVDNKQPQKGHLLARVLEDDPRVLGLAPQTVGCHHHGQVIHVHLGLAYVGRLGKDLEEKGMQRKVSGQTTPTALQYKHGVQNTGWGAGGGVRRRDHY